MQVMPGILFSDQRSIEECEYIQETLGEERILSITGNRVMPGTCSAPTILWLKNKHSEEYQKTYKFMQPSTYFVYKLTGHVVIDRSRAIPTLIYDINNDTWSRIICDGLGVDITKLPEVRLQYLITTFFSKLLLI